MRDPERVEGGVPRVVGDQQEVDVVRHDDEIGERRAGENPVQGEQGGFHGFAVRQQLRAGLFVEKARQCLRPSLDGDGDEEELAALAFELQFHRKGSIGKRESRVKGAVTYGRF